MSGDSPLFLNAKSKRCTQKDCLKFRGYPAFATVLCVVSNKLVEGNNGEQSYFEQNII